MSVALNGIAHIQLTVNDPARCLPFWEKLCHFCEMHTLVRTADTLYCIGSRTGILVRGAPAGRDGGPFDQLRAGLHHFCLRARSRADVDAVARFAQAIGAKIVHPAEESAPPFAGPAWPRLSPRGQSGSGAWGRPARGPRRVAPLGAPAATGWLRRSVGDATRVSSHSRSRPWRVAPAACGRARDAFAPPESRGRPPRE
jgi:catechol 2,3-dioxygenase-like lactoylglutathione lyase family enzyme